MWTGRLVFLGAETEAGQSQPQQADLRSAGYYWKMNSFKDQKEQLKMVK